MTEGSWVKVLSLPEFVAEIRDEVRKLSVFYVESGSEI